MRKKRKIIATILAFAVLAIPASAALVDTSLSGGTSNYDWDPTVSRVRIDDASGSVRMISYFKWSDVSNFPKVADGQYYTHEHYDFNDSGSASEDDMYSNLPYAKFDIDNDLLSPTWGDEELEVTCANTGDTAPVYANASYFFDTTWTDPIGTRTFKGSIRSQLSSKSLISSEYQAIDTEYKGDLVSEYTYGGMVSTSVNSQMEENHMVDTNLYVSTAQTDTAGKDVEEIRIVHENTDEYNVEMLKNDQMAVLDASLSAEEADLLENSTVVLTFTKPITSAELGKLLTDSNAMLGCSVVRFADAEGNRITGWTSDVSEEHLMEKLNYLKEVHGDVSYSGIVSATVTVDLNRENYDELANCDYVHFADLSDTLIRLERKDFNRELDVEIWDMSWDLEFANK